MVSATDEPRDEAEEDNATPSIFKAVECLTKGLEVPLPDGHRFWDKDGIERTRVRVRWWDDRATTYRAAAMMPDEERAALQSVCVPGLQRGEGRTSRGLPVRWGSGVVAERFVWVA